MTTKLLNYRGAIRKLPSLIEEMEATKVLLVTGKHSYEQFRQKGLIEEGLQNFEIKRHSDFSVNPKVEELETALEKYRNFQPDVIVGIGGGSVLDTAKLMAVFLNYSGNIADFILSGKKVENRDIPLILIPTTAGTGSEATHFAVVYLGKEKYSVAAPCLLPDKVILDADLTDNIPVYLSACTAFDALSQAVESFWAKGATLESRQFALESITIIMEVYNKLILSPDKLVREEMLYASYLAGKAINVSKTTAPHALSYGITTNFGLPHGHAVAVTLGKFVVFNSKNSSDTDWDLLFQMLGCRNAEEVERKLEDMMKLAGMKTKIVLESKARRKEDVRELMHHVNIERLGNNPVPVKTADLEAIYSSIFEVSK